MHTLQRMHRDGNASGRSFPTDWARRTQRDMSGRLLRAGTRRSRNERHLHRLRAAAHKIQSGLEVGKRKLVGADLSIGSRPDSINRMAAGQQCGPRCAPRTSSSFSLPMIVQSIVVPLPNTLYSTKVPSLRNLAG
jgi:hypothetical protein